MPADDTKTESIIDENQNLEAGLQGGEVGEILKQFNHLFLFNPKSIQPLTQQIVVLY